MFPTPSEFFLETQERPLSEIDPNMPKQWYKSDLRELAIDPGAYGGRTVFCYIIVLVFGRQGWDYY